MHAFSAAVTRRVNPRLASRACDLALPEAPWLSLGISLEESSSPPHSQAAGASADHILRWHEPQGLIVRRVIFSKRRANSIQTASKQHPNSMVMLFARRLHGVCTAFRRRLVRMKLRSCAIEPALLRPTARSRTLCGRSRSQSHYWDSVPSNHAISCLGGT